MSNEKAIIDWRESIKNLENKIDTLTGQVEDLKSRLKDQESPPASSEDHSEDESEDDDDDFPFA